jgi:hypothetical protein
MIEHDHEGQTPTLVGEISTELLEAFDIGYLEGYRAAIRHTKREAEAQMEREEYGHAKQACGCILSAINLLAHDCELILANVGEVPDES